MSKQNTFLIRISMILNYMVFAVLLNSVGTVILQVQRNYDISKAGASILEGFKDIPIAICSLILASFLPRIGIKRGMMIGLFIVAISCLLIANFADDFWYFKLLFMMVGVSFALIKISVFSAIGLVTDDVKGHSSLMSLIEGFFMIGVLAGNVFFSLFIDDMNPRSQEWLNVYWYLSVISLLAALLLYFSKLDESQAQNKDSEGLLSDFAGMWKLVLKPLAIVFVISAFLFVLIEQSFQTWTPTFYSDVLSVPASMSIQAGAVLAGAFAAGRLLAGVILKYVLWIRFAVLCVAMVGVCVLLNMPLTQNLPAMSESITWFNAPLVVYLFPLMGIFLAPVYPTINSVVLSALPKFMHSSMSGLIVLFSALGGTTGSIITGHLFESFGGVKAFYFSLIPVAALIVSMIFLYKISSKDNNSQNESPGYT